MISVHVTVAMGARTVPVEDVKDSRIRSGLLAAAKQVSTALGLVQCPAHAKGPTNVRIHFDKSGAADLKYDSCCAELGKLVGKALG